MARSLGLTAYRALTRRTEATFQTPAQNRPSGELLWIHVGEPRNLLAVQDLARRLISNRPGLNALLSLPPGADRDLAEQGSDLIHVEVPGEHPASVTAFFEHWQPDIGIWVWGGLRPNLLLDAHDRQIPLFLIDADNGGFDARRDRWLPDLTRRLLSQFHVVLARSLSGQRRLISLGMPQRDVELITPLLAGGQTLDCRDSDLTELSAALGGRPAWFAVCVHPKEITTILKAHRTALRWSHRLLLILNPNADSDADEWAAALADSNLRTSDWDAGDFPDEVTQVLLTHDPADRGLFFRIAPVSFLGSTLIQSEGGSNPLDAAALGSAILYGPKVRHFVGSYSRLAAAGAARIVNDADALSTAVTRLIAPDQAAAMAHAGWEVISQGAQLMDRVVEFTQETLDKKGAGY